MTWFAEEEQKEYRDVEKDKSNNEKEEDERNKKLRNIKVYSYQNLRKYKTQFMT